METSVRSELHKMIDDASDDRIQEIYDWINNGIGETTRYSADEIKEFYNLLVEHEEGLGESYTVEEIFPIAKGIKTPPSYEKQSLQFTTHPSFIQLLQRPPNHLCGNLQTIF
jgi:hypothetical protein